MKKIELFFIYFIFTFKSFSPASGKEKVRFLDSPDFDNFQGFQIGRDVR